MHIFPLKHYVKNVFGPLEFGELKCLLFVHVFYASDACQLDIQRLMNSEHQDKKISIKIKDAAFIHLKHLCMNYTL